VIRESAASPDADASEYIISCADIRKSFAGFAALKGVTFKVRRGEIVCIVGPSGSGKSTLLRTINALEEVDSGDICVDGITIPGPHRDIQRVRQEVGMVFQNFNLFPHLTVAKNIALAPMRTRGTSKDDAYRRADRLLERVGLKDQRDKYPDQLSGGQRQRVAIARALAMEPRALLFDEPTSALDPEMVNEVLLVIKEVVESGMTSVIVTHELNFAREVADRIVFMVDGSIVFEAPPDQFFTSNVDPRLAAFLSKML
jgi:aspartate/glutamate/glutamine transport system ATP-binding protein